MNIKEVKYTELIVDKMNVRHNWISDKELSESIKAQGIIHPLTVRTVKNKYGIVCGSRRYQAGMESGLKYFPCIIKSLSDLEAKALSLQENIRNKSLGTLDEADAIADIWEMMNGSKPYNEKMKEMKKQFGLSERSIANYLAVSRLSDKLKERFTAGNCRNIHNKMDIETGAGISTSNWNEKEKQQAGKILSGIESYDRRKKVLSQMKSHTNLSPKESYDKIKKIPEGVTYSITLSPKTYRAFGKACTDKGKSYKELLPEAIEFALKKWGYIK